MSYKGEQFNVDKLKLVLSSKSLFYKTENFIKKTKYVSNLNLLLTKFCETIIFNQNNIKISKNDNQDLDCFLISSLDNKYTFLFKFGYQINSTLNDFDIVFFDYISDSNLLNERVDEYIDNSLNIKVKIESFKKLVKFQDFNKLYLISNISNVNLPRLSKEQKEIVETIDKNILVQGIAGSGKTNICIDKIIFTACKNYSGKVLYTTFSRGLLIDTKLKIENYKKDLEDVVKKFKSNDIIFLDDNHKKALENRLGIYFFSDDDDKILNKLENIISYLENKVDYFLIEDIYKNTFKEDKEFVGQNYFVNIYSKNLKNHQIEKSFLKLTKYSKEIIYKEIFGMIYGYYSLNDNNEIMPLKVYTEARKNSFSSIECQAIYQIAVDYKKYCEHNNLIDNNSASKQLINLLDSKNNNLNKKDFLDNKNGFNSKFEYSLSIIDEVQDYTQVNLCLFKKLSLKLFCVGDAQQMINPSYFSFGYLKNLLYEKNLTDVKELKHNYRNSEKIEKIIDSLSEINIKEFGTHNFVLKGESIDNGIDSKAVYISDKEFIDNIANNGFDDVTFVVSSLNEKQQLQRVLKNFEILTVSEIKGLERNTIITYNILTANDEKWKLLDANKVNHKQADENSVFRYYYNLFYVGLSRAKQNIFIVEDETIKQFQKFFKENFENKTSKNAISLLSEIVSKSEFTQKEFIERVDEFIKQEQFENAKFAANKIKDSTIRIDKLRTIEVYENLIHYGKYREAGIKFWEYGLIDEAKKQFTLSGDTILIELLDSCNKGSNKDLNIDIIQYYLDVKDNKLASDFIMQTINKDINQLKQSFKYIKNNFEKIRR